MEDMLEGTSAREGWVKGRVVERGLGFIGRAARVAIAKRGGDQFGW